MNEREYKENDIVWANINYEDCKRVSIMDCDLFNYIGPVTIEGKASRKPKYKLRFPICVDEDDNNYWYFNEDVLTEL